MSRQSDKLRDPTQVVGLQLRFREALRAELEDAARMSGNSLNSEIGDRLARSLVEDQILGRGPTRSLMIELAGEIGRAESWTGKSWQADPTTYWLMRKLVDDALHRSRPKPPDMEAIEEEQVKLAELRDRRDRLMASLRECGALQPPQSALVGLTRYEGKAPLEPTPEDEWHAPASSQMSLSEDDRTKIREWLESLVRIENEIELGEIVVWELLAPWREARERGLAFHRHLTAPSPEFREKT